MYYYLNGILVLLNGSSAAIDCGGVCYRLTVSMQTYSALSPFVNKTARLYTYLAVREDGMELYGFSTEEEKDAFIKLIAISGIGPKAAMGILSSFTPQRLAALISANDAKSISTAPGIGLKTAQKIILELKDKLIGLGSSTMADEPSAGGSDVSEAINTLVVLGYSRSDALNAVRGLEPDLPLEDMIRQALKKLAKAK